MILARWEWCIVKEKEGTKTMITYVPFTCQWKDSKHAFKILRKFQFWTVLKRKDKIISAVFVWKKITDLLKITHCLAYSFFLIFFFFNFLKFLRMHVSRFRSGLQTRHSFSSKISKVLFQNVYIFNCLFL